MGEDTGATRTQPLGQDEIAQEIRAHVADRQYFLAVEAASVMRMVPLFDRQSIVVGREAPAASISSEGLPLCSKAGGRARSTSI